MKLVAADAAHIPFLASAMRDMDRLEIGAFGMTPEKALRHGLKSSLWALSAIVEGEPHAMMGVSPINVMQGLGAPWMLGSERVYSHARDLARYGPGIIAEMRQGFERLENVVHTGNVRAIRFLHHFGWQISDQPEVYGGVEFVRFY